MNSAFSTTATEASRPFLSAVPMVVGYLSIHLRRLLGEMGTPRRRSMLAQISSWDSPCCAQLWSRSRPVGSVQSSALGRFLGTPHTSSIQALCGALSARRVNLSHQFSLTASRPVNCCQRSMMTSAYCGSYSIVKQRRFICSQAISVLPLPPNKSSTICPGLELFLMR